ncbi:MAG: MFS transporter [Acidobacteria bacterium]|nr:MFS transporter [Acidobacteriota bacterium]MBV9476839.1 MFS transporter [Acidobacteriota bacterium]
MPRTKLQPQVILLGIVSLLNDAASEMIYPLLPVFLTATLGATPAVVGLIEGLADGLASILKYFAGAWSDRMPRRKPFVATGYALAAGSRALIAAAGAWPLVLAARLIDRTGKGIRSAPRDAMISDVTPREQRGRAFGFHRALDHTGAIVGPLLAMLALDVAHWTLRRTFYVSVIPGAIGVVLIAWLLREPARETTSRLATDSATPLPPVFRQALAAIALFSLANSSDAFLLLQAHAAGVSTAMLPALWAAHHVIKSLFSTRAGALSDRIDRRYLLVAGWTSYAILYAIFPFARSLAFFLVLFILYAIPFTLAEGAERAWIADLVPADARGKSFGLYYLANGLCVLAGTMLFGVLYERCSPRVAFDTGAALALAAVVAVLLTRRARTS